MSAPLIKTSLSTGGCGSELLSEEQEKKEMDNSTNNNFFMAIDFQI